MKYLPIFCALIFSSAAESATRYVNPAHPQSVNSGAGAATAPYKTISYAMNQLVSGDRLVIAAGTYREALSPKYKAANLVIEGSPGTMIKGSDVVTGWVSAGSGRFVRRNWTVNSQQVHVNGVSYQQIGGAITSTISPSWWPGRVAGGVSSMTPNSFYYDAGGRSLYIKPADGTLSQKTVEVSVRERLGIGTGLNNIQFKNLSFMHSNTSATARGGALVFNGNRLSLDNISVTRTDLAGLAVNGDHNVISNSVANYNGQAGMFVRGRYAKLINNETSYNNTRGFAQFWEAGGAKFIAPGGTSPGGLMDSVISGHKAMYNNGTGLWLDYNLGGGNKILNSVVAYNQTYGIYFEVSSGVQIYNNLVYGNKERGIYIASSSNALVAHNLSANNGSEGIIIHNNRRATTSYLPYALPRNNQVIGNIVGWSGGDCLRNGDKTYNNKANGNLYVNATLCKFAQERTGQWALRATGLPQWKGVSGQDSSSWEKITSLGSVSVSTLSARQANVDWSSLKSLASQYKAPPTPLDSGLPPGPVSYSFGGGSTTVATTTPSPSAVPALQTASTPTSTSSSTNTAGNTGGTTPPAPAPTTKIASTTPMVTSVSTTTGYAISPVLMPLPAAVAIPAATSPPTPVGSALSMPGAMLWAKPATTSSPMLSLSARYGVFPITSLYTLPWQRGDFRTFFFNSRL